MNRLALLPLLCAVPAAGPPEDDPPIELGLVDWSRDHDAALARARREKKPVLILFQEVPGCSTCKDYGGGPLSSPLVVSAIQAEFVPLAVLNNRPGADAELLRRYGEPAWNNPVMRFFAAGGSELVPRAPRAWDEASVTGRMVAALEAAGRGVPAYLRIAHEEALRVPLERAVFGMHCFWEGEAVLGGLAGVRSTRVGWQAGGEVVEVTYDPSRIGFEELVREARRQRCARRVWATEREQLEGLGEAGEGVLVDSARPRDARPGDQKYHLRHSELRFLPLTPLQATRANALLAKDGSASGLLSPEQAALLARIRERLRANPSALEGLEPLPAPTSAAYMAELERRLEG